MRGSHQSFLASALLAPGRQQVMPAADTRPEPFSDTLSGWAVLPLPGAELRRTIARCRRRSWDRGCDGRILR
jgi:hypothetical protein